MKNIAYIIIAVLACSSSFAQQPFNWVSAPEGASSDQAWSITLDKNGNVYHVGSYNGTTDFDPSNSGIANLTSSNAQDAYFAKYDNNGNYIWAKSIGGMQNDYCYKLVVDDTGNVYITGIFNTTIDLDPGAGTANFTTVGGSDIFFAKYDSNGNYLWGKSMGSTQGEQSRLLSVTKDGNIYLCGHLNASADLDPGTGVAIQAVVGPGNLFIAKYDNAGNYLWARSAGSMGADDIDVYGMARDSMANIYLSGSFTGTVDVDPGAGVSNITAVAGADIYFVKFDSSGNFIWARSLGGGTVSSNDQAWAITVNNSGEIYLGGVFSSTVDFDPGAGTVNLTGGSTGDMFIAHYDALGNYIYAKALTGPGSEFLHGVAIDGDGHLYITGQLADTVDFDPDAGTFYIPPNGTQQIFLAEYDELGQLVYAYGIGGTGPDYAHAIVLDKLNNAYISGAFSDITDFDPGSGNTTLVCSNGTRIFAAKFGDSTLGSRMLVEDEGSEMIFYPNPAKEKLSVKVNGRIQAVQVIEITGKTLLCSKDKEVNTTELSPGLYLLRVQTDDYIYTRMFRKE